MSEQTVQDERTEFIRGLRELADYMEAEPKASLPSDFARGFNIFASTRAELEQAARIFGDEAQEQGTTYDAMIYREFSGGVRLNVRASLSQIGAKIPVRVGYEPILPEKAEVGS